MNLTKILVGTALGTTLLIQGCVSNLGTRMFEICSPLSNVPRTKLDDKVKQISDETIPYFNEWAKDSLVRVQYRSANSEELGQAMGRYVFLNGGIIFVEDNVIDDSDVQETMFHEMIHRLDYTGKIDRLKFFAIYDRIDSNEFGFKKRIEYLLASKEYNSSFWKDPQSERIAYTYDYWYSQMYEIPSELIEFSKAFLKEDFVAERQDSQKDLYIANR